MDLPKLKPNTVYKYKGKMVLATYGLGEPILRPVHSDTDIGKGAGLAVPFQYTMCEDLEELTEKDWDDLAALNPKWAAEFRPLASNIDIKPEELPYYDGGRTRHYIGDEYPAHAAPRISELKFVDLMKILPAVEKILAYCQEAGIQPEELVRAHQTIIDLKKWTEEKLIDSVTGDPKQFKERTYWDGRIAVLSAVKDGLVTIAQGGDAFIVNGHQK